MSVPRKIKGWVEKKIRRHLMRAGKHIGCVYNNGVGPYSIILRVYISDYRAGYQKA
jgi:hypothetical protein